jgi:hypothetical protein
MLVIEGVFSSLRPINLSNVHPFTLFHLSPFIMAADKFSKTWPFQTYSLKPTYPLFGMVAMATSKWSFV